VAAAAAAEGEEEGRERIFGYIPCIGYADDLKLFASSVGDAGALLAEAAAWLRRVGLALSRKPSKTSLEAYGLAEGAVGGLAVQFNSVGDWIVSEYACGGEEAAAAVSGLLIPALPADAETLYLGVRRSLLGSAASAVERADRATAVHSTLARAANGVLGAPAHHERHATAVLEYLAPPVDVPSAVPQRWDTRVRRIARAHLGAGVPVSLDMLELLTNCARPSQRYRAVVFSSKYHLLHGDDLGGRFGRQHWAAGSDGDTLGRAQIGRAHV